MAKKIRALAGRLFKAKLGSFENPLPAPTYDASEIGWC